MSRGDASGGSWLPSGLAALATSLHTAVNSAVGDGSAGLIPVKAADGNEYLVRDLRDKRAAADRLARIRGGVLRLMTHLRQSHAKHPVAAAILAGFDAAPARFRESLPDAAYTSYSVNKGERVHMCLRQKDGAETLVPDNVLTFVALHEMAHIGTAEVGHTPAFWANMAWLLRQAEDVGVYQYTDFKRHPVSYCGLEITDAPTSKGGPEAGAAPRG
jgi:hypothetical protein